MRWKTLRSRASAPPFPLPPALRSPHKLRSPSRTRPCKAFRAQMALSCPAALPRHTGHTAPESSQQRARRCRHKFQCRRLAAIARGRRVKSIRSPPHVPLSPFAVDGLPVSGAALRQRRQQHAPRPPREPPRPTRSHRAPSQTMWPLPTAHPAEAQSRREATESRIFVVFVIASRAAISASKASGISRSISSGCSL